jgi:hypothetical protein
MSQVAGMASPGNSATFLISIDPSLCAFISIFHEQDARKAHQVRTRADGLAPEDRRGAARADLDGVTDGAGFGVAPQGRQRDKRCGTDLRLRTSYPPRLFF